MTIAPFAITIRFILDFFENELFGDSMANRSVGLYFENRIPDFSHAGTVILRNAALPIQFAKWPGDCVAIRFDPRTRGEVCLRDRFVASLMNQAGVDAGRKFVHGDSLVFGYGPVEEHNRFAIYALRLTRADAPEGRMLPVGIVLFQMAVEL